MSLPTKFPKFKLLDYHLDLESENTSCPLSRSRKIKIILVALTRKVISQVGQSTIIENLIYANSQSHCSCDDHYQELRDTCGKIY